MLVDKETAMKKIIIDVTKYITSRYGSVVAFLLLKYLLEHKLAREKKGYTVYEIAFEIAPSIVLTRKTLVKIECRADGTSQAESEAGLELLIQRKIVTIDSETGILSLNVPVNSIANVFLKKSGPNFEVISDQESADVI